jgi:hypothetical protein
MTAALIIAADEPVFHQRLSVTQESGLEVNNNCEVDQIDE